MAVVPKVAQQEVALARLDAAAGENSWENMRETHPEIAARIEQAVSVGVTSEQVYSLLLTNHGSEFCKWCRTVARYLEGAAEAG